MSERPAAPPADPFIRMEAVSRRYAMGATQVAALDGVSLTVRDGEFVAVVGRSGSGKSTLLHLLAAMDRPDEGTITVGTWQLGTLARAEQAQYRRTMVGIVFQQFNLIPTMTALDNVELPLVLGGAAPRPRRQRAAEALATVGLAERMDHRPAELSGGEQQRVAIARALVSDPAFLLCDEPTGNLDSATSQRILDLIATLHREHGTTILLVTHQPDEVEALADRMLHLHDGRLVQ
ncbi:MAG: ABC transporter ATP-binding protein [Bacteroidota bacterium]